MKKLKISLIAIALVIGGVQAYGGLKFATYYAAPGTEITDTYYTVAASSPALGCLGGTPFVYVCTFTANGSYSPNQQVSSAGCTVLSTYED